MASTTIGKIKERIRENLALMTVKVRINNAVGHTDINHEAEDFYCGLLNTAFGWKLTNQNQLSMNFPSIDLGDPDAQTDDGRKGIAVQVTSAKDRSKIQRTLDKFFEHQYEKCFERLIVLIIGEKRRYQTDFTLKGPLSFEKTADIWDREDLIRKIEALPERVLVRVDEFLQAQHPVPDRYHPDQTAAVSFAGSRKASEIADTGLTGLEHQLVTESFDFSKIIHSKTKDFVGRRSIHTQVEKWIREEPDKRILILVGSAGVGKTSFCARLGYTIHICSFDNAASTDARNVMGSLAYQLSMVIEDYAEHLSSIAESDRLRSKSIMQLFCLLFVDALERLPCPGSPVIVIVDAVDEMDPRQKDEFLFAISSQQSSLPDWFRIILTTRPNSAVVEYLPYSKIIDMDCNDAENRSDCRCYLKARLDKLNISYTSEALDSVIENSDGNFLYIVYLTEDIATRGIRVLDVKELPKNIGVFYLNWLYSAFCGNITEYRSRMLPILQLLCAVKGTVTLEEISQILGEPKSVIMDLIRQTRSIINRNADDTISFYHKAVKDWLCDPIASVSYYVDSAKGAGLIVRHIKDEYDMTGMLPETAYITKYGGAHLIEECEASLFYNIYTEKHGTQKDEFCRAFAQVRTEKLSRFLTILKRRIDPPSFWEVLNNVVSVCNDLGGYRKTVELCGLLMSGADKYLEILLDSFLCIAYIKTDDSASSLTQAEQMAALIWQFSGNPTPEESYIRAVFNNAVGYVRGFFGMRVQAIAHHEESIRQAQPLVDGFDENLRKLSAQQVYHGFSNLAYQMAGHDSTCSEEYCRLALAAAQKASQMSNEHRNQLNEQNAYNSLITCMLHDYQFQDAIELCREAIPSAENLAAQYPSFAANRSLAVLYHLVGKAAAKLSGDTEECLVYYQRALSLIETNRSVFPSENANRDLALGYMKFAQLYLEQKDMLSARRFLEKAIVIYERLTKLFPSQRYVHDLAHCYLLDANTYLGSKNDAMAIGKVSLALEHLRAVKPTTNQIRADICWCHQMLGDLFVDHGKEEDAVCHYSMLREIALSILVHGPVTSSLVYVIFADLKLAFLRKSQGQIRKGLEYVCHSLEVCLDSFGVRADALVVSEAAARFLAAPCIDILTFYGVMKELLGDERTSPENKQFRILEQAFYSFASRC